MKKAMNITVGTGENVSDGICYSIKQQNPDYILFLSSEEGKQKTIPEIKEKLQNIDKISEVKIFDEINDIDTIYKCYDEAINEVIRKDYNANEIVVDFTSGTKSMSSSLAVAGIFREVGTISYVYGSRDEKMGRVISGSERLCSFFPLKISIEKKLSLFKIFFNTYQFESALKILEEIKSLRGGYKTEETDTLTYLTNAYNLWDKFNFDNAHNNFKELRNNKYISNWGLKSSIERNKNFLYQELNNIYCNERLYDLYLNAERRIAEGKYDDAAARYYRLLEYLAQLLLYRNKPSFETGDIDIGNLPENLKEKYSKKKGNKKILELGLVDSYILLKELNNKIGIKFCRDLDNKNIKKLLGIRNNSILAHGFAPVSQKSVNEIKNIIEGYIFLFDSVWESKVKNGKFPKINF